MSFSQAQRGRGLDQDYCPCPFASAAGRAKARLEPSRVEFGFGAGLASGIDRGIRQTAHHSPDHPRHQGRGRRSPHSLQKVCAHSGASARWPAAILRVSLRPVSSSNSTKCSDQPTSEGATPRTSAAPPPGGFGWRFDDSQGPPFPPAVINPEYPLRQRNAVNLGQRHVLPPQPPRAFSRCGLQSPANPPPAHARARTGFQVLRAAHARLHSYFDLPRMLRALRCRSNTPNPSKPPSKSSNAATTK